MRDNKGGESKYTVTFPIKMRNTKFFWKGFNTLLHSMHEEEEEIIDIGQDEEQE